MVTIEQIYQSIAETHERINEVNKRLDDAFRLMHDENAANIDYLAMMTETSLPGGDSSTATTEGEE